MLLTTINVAKHLIRSIKFDLSTGDERTKQSNNKEKYINL